MKRAHAPLVFPLRSTFFLSSSPPDTPDFLSDPADRQAPLAGSRFPPFPEDRTAEEKRSFLGV